jgi:hypothetical protein
MELGSTKKQLTPDELQEAYAELNLMGLAILKFQQEFDALKNQWINLSILCDRLSPDPAESNRELAEGIFAELAELAERITKIKEEREAKLKTMGV